MKALHLSAIAWLLMAVNCPATTRIWSGAGPDSSWTNAANWGGTAPAVNNDGLVFAGSQRLYNTNNYAAITNVSVTFSNAGFSLYGSPVTLNGSITNRTGTNTINTDLALQLLPTISIPAGQLNLNGVISGGFGLTVRDSGVLQLGRANGYTGNTTITPTANLIITNANALGYGSVNQSGKAGGTLGGCLVLAFPPTSNNTITNGFLGFASTSSGDTAPPNLLNLSGTNTITAARFVNSGGGNGDVVQSDGGRLILAGRLYPTLTSRVIQLAGSGEGWVTGPIEANGFGYFPRKYGTGKWTLFGTNTYTGGDLEIYQGTLALGATALLNTGTRGVNMVRAGTIFDVSALPGGWVMQAGQALSGFGSVVGSVVTPPSATAIITPGTGLGQSVIPISGNLSLGGGPTTINFNLSDDPTGLIHPSDKIVVAGNLTAQNMNNIVLGAYIGFLNNGIYPLIQYGGTFTGEVTNFSVAGFTAIARGVQGGYITNLNKAISLVVTGTPAANLVWRGNINNNWDTNTPNFSNLGSSSSDKFYNYDAVAFDDSATNFMVNIVTNVTVGGYTVNASSNYTINAGTGVGGVIGGNAGLTKLRSGKLTLTGNHTYTGPNYFGGGVVSVPLVAAGASPIGNANASIGANQLFNGGTLEYTGGGEATTRFFQIGTNGGTISVADPNATLTISSSGGMVSTGTAYPCLTKAGPGTLAFSLQQQLLGTNRIIGGILKLNGLTTGTIFGTDQTSPVIINGGALDFNSLGLGLKPVVVSGMGDLVTSGGMTNGAVINSGGTINQALQFVTLTGDAAFGGTGRWDIRGNPTASLSTGGNAYNLVKAGPNQISLVDVTVDSALANIEVQAGILSLQAGTTGLGNPANTLTVRNGGTFDLFAAVNALNKNIVLYDGSTLGVSSGANTIVGPVNMMGDAFAGPTINVASGASLNLSGVLSGAGNLTLSGGGTLTLTATNTYAGTTTVNAGKLVVSTRNIGAGAITVSDGASLGVTVSGASQLKPDTLTLGNSAGPVTTEFNGVGSTTVAPINATNLVVNGPTTINILSGTFLAGQTYPLISFDTISGAGSFVVGTLPPLISATVVTTGNTVALSVSSSAAIEYWTGRVNGNWDINATTNWTFNGVAAKYANGNVVQFDDSASNATVAVTTPVLPNGVFVNNNLLDYAFSGSPIGGASSLTKLGVGALTLSSANSYSGGTILSAGTLNINNNAALGTGLVSINGGTIDNTGGGPVTVTNAQAWNSDFTYTGSQDLTLTVAGVTLSTNRQITATGAGNLTVNSMISDGGSGYGLTKAGAGGTLTLSGANSYTGGTTVNEGTLILQGNQTAANGGLLVGPDSTGGAMTIAAGATVSVAATNQLGATNIIQVGNSVASGTTTINLNVLGTVTNRGALLAARTSVVTLNTNSLWWQQGDMEVLGVGGFDANLSLSAGSTFRYTGVNTIKLNGADGNSGRGFLNLNGGQFVTGAAFEQTTASSGYGRVGLNNGGILKLSAAVADLTLNGAQFATFNAGGTVDTAGFDAGISAEITGSGSLTKAGAGALTLASFGPLGYTGDTLISGGTLVLSNYATLTSTNILIGGGANLDVAPLIIQPYVLGDYQVLGNLSSTAVLNGSVDAASAPATLSLAYTAGTPALTVANGSLTLAEMTAVRVNNTGSPLANGNYKLISAGVGGSVAGTVPASVLVTGNGMGTGGVASLSLTGNELYLGVTGAVVVNTNTFTIGTVITPTSIQLSWPPDRLGWKVQTQTNALNVGLGTNWFVWPGSSLVTNLNIPINPANPSVFIRMTYP